MDRTDAEEIVGLDLVHARLWVLVSRALTYVTIAMVVASCSLAVAGAVGAVDPLAWAPPAACAAASVRLLSQVKAALIAGLSS